jgi:hypothetical protein
MIRRGVLLLLCAAAAAAATPADAATVVSYERGWYESTGVHLVGNDNYFAGRQDETPFDEKRNFFVFDLSGFSSITSATLELLVGPTPPFDSIISIGGTETYTLFDFGGSISDLTGGTGGVLAYTDLGTGTSYGSIVVTDGADEGTVISITLNAAGIAAANAAAGGDFAIGGAITSLLAAPPPWADEYVFGFTGSGDPSDGNTRLIVEGTPANAAVPEPASLVVFGTLFSVGAIAARRKRKKA